METRNPPSAASRTRMKVAAVATPLLVAIAGAALWFPQGSGRTPSAKSPEKSALASNIAAAPSSPQQNGDISQPTIPWVRTLSHLPVTPAELAAAHEQAKANACEALPVGEPAFATEFLPCPTDGGQQPDSGPPALGQRRPAFSVGLDMSKQDQADLPALSGGQILDYLHENYISMQVRLLKTPGVETLFLHHRPLACVTDFRGAAKTEKPTSGMNESLSNYRSLGVYLPAGELPTPARLRTLVLLHKGQREQEKGGTKDTFEYAFVRLSEKLTEGKPKVVLAAFVTSDERSRLHYLHVNDSPADVNDCSLKSLIRITKYSFGIYPSDSETLDTIFNDEAEYVVADLEAYAASQGWQGELWDHLNQLLDAAIEAKLPRQPSSAK